MTTNNTFSDSSIIQTTPFVLYSLPDAAVTVDVHVADSTIWLSQKQMSLLFGVTVSAVNQHLSNIFETKELERSSTIKNFLIVASNGGKYDTKLYNLDAIISVGYRVNSGQATQFRIRATKILRQHVLDGYTIDEKRVLTSSKKFLHAYESAKKMLQQHSLSDETDLLDLIEIFSQTRYTLDAFDMDTLPSHEEYTQETLNASADELYEGIENLKTGLIKKGEASDLFGTEKEHLSLEGIMGNVMQTVFGADAYPSLEEKASHLLYFVVKDHPFNDGNKRIGAFSFVRLLYKGGQYSREYISPQALAAITLLIAQSNPKDKERMIKLVMSLI